MQDVIEPPHKQTEREELYKRGYSKVLYASDVRLVLINKLCTVIIVCLYFSCRFGESIFPLIRWFLLDMANRILFISQMVAV